MNKNQLLKIVNPLLGVLLLNQALSGVFGDTLGPELFEVLHVTGAVLLVVGVIVHVFLNWTWVAHNLLRKKPAA